MAIFQTRFLTSYPSRELQPTRTQIANSAQNQNEVKKNVAEGYWLILLQRVKEPRTLNDTPLDILYVITDLEIGGVPLHLLRLATAMRDRGYSVAVACLAPPGPITLRLQSAGIEVYSCQGRGGRDWRVIGRLKRLLAKTSPRIVHAFLFHANLAVRLAARGAGISAQRVLCEIQTVEVERPWHLTLDRWTYKRCRLTIGNSQSVVEHLSTHARIPRQHLQLVRGGIDAKKFQLAAPIDLADIALPIEAKLVLWVGRLDPVKGLNHLIDAFATMDSHTDAHLVLVGGGQMQAELRDRVTRAGMTSRIHLLGPRDDVPQLLRSAHVFVFPSQTEGLPNALLEAMACGLPVITTNAPGCRDLVTHEKTGLVVPYGDVSKLADAMDELLSNQQLADQLGQRAQQEIQDHWQLKQTLDTYERLYRDILVG